MVSLNFYLIRHNKSKNCSEMDPGELGHIHYLLLSITISLNNLDNSFKIILYKKYNNNPINILFLLLMFNTLY